MEMMKTDFLKSNIVKNTRQWWWQVTLAE